MFKGRNILWTGESAAQKIASFLWDEIKNYWKPTLPKR